MWDEKQKRKLCLLIMVLLALESVAIKLQDFKTINSPFSTQQLQENKFNDEIFLRLMGLEEHQVLDEQIQKILLKYRYCHKHYQQVIDANKEPLQSAKKRKDQRDIQRYINIRTKAQARQMNNCVQKRTKQIQQRRQQIRQQRQRQKIKLELDQKNKIALQRIRKRKQRQAKLIQQQKEIQVENIDQKIAKMIQENNKLKLKRQQIIQSQQKYIAQLTKKYNYLIKKSQISQEQLIKKIQQRIKITKEKYVHTANLLKQLQTHQQFNKEHFLKLQNHIRQQLKTERIFFGAHSISLENSIMQLQQLLNKKRSHSQKQKNLSDPIFGQIQNFFRSIATEENIFKQKIYELENNKERKLQQMKQQQKTSDQQTKTKHSFISQKIKVLQQYLIFVKDLVNKIKMYSEKLQKICITSENSQQKQIKKQFQEVRALLMKLLRSFQQEFQSIAKEDRHTLQQINTLMNDKTSFQNDRNAVQALITTQQAQSTLLLEQIQSLVSF